MLGLTEPVGATSWECPRRRVRRLTAILGSRRCRSTRGGSSPALRCTGRHQTVRPVSSSPPRSPSTGTGSPSSRSPCSCSGSRMSPRRRRCTSSRGSRRACSARPSGARWPTGMDPGGSPAGRLSGSARLRRGSFLPPRREPSGLSLSQSVDPVFSAQSRSPATARASRGWPTSPGCFASTPSTARFSNRACWWHRH